MRRLEGGANSHFKGRQRGALQGMGKWFIRIWLISGYLNFIITDFILHCIEKHNRLAENEIQYIFQLVWKDFIRGKHTVNGI